MDRKFSEIAEYNIAKSHRVYETALLTFKDGDYNSSINRAYYAVFHMICAVLILEGKSYKEHSDVLAEFNRFYLKDKIFTEFSYKMIEKLSRARNNSDYTDMFWASADETIVQLENAKIICDAIEPYIKNRIISDG